MKKNACYGNDSNCSKNVNGFYLTFQISCLDYSFNNHPHQISASICIDYKHLRHFHLKLVRNFITNLNNINNNKKDNNNNNKTTKKIVCIVSFFMWVFGFLPCVSTFGSRVSLLQAILNLLYYTDRKTDIVLVSPNTQRVNRG